MSITNATATVFVAVLADSQSSGAIWASAPTLEALEAKIASLGGQTVILEGDALRNEADYEIWTLPARLEADLDAHRGHELLEEYGELQGHYVDRAKADRERAEFDERLARRGADFERALGWS